MQDGGVKIVNRGDVLHRLVTELVGNDAMPPLDLLFFQRETGTGLN